MVTFGGMRSMWVIVMFDLPTSTKSLMKAYRIFRNGLLRDGFTSLQYSVYARHCFSYENAKIHENRVKKSLPDAGEVRMLTFTDKQFSRMERFQGKSTINVEKSSAQISLF